MALTSTTRGYIGKGPIYIQKIGGVEAPIAIGNTISLSLNLETDRKARIDYQTAGGGELDVLERITAMAGEMVMDDFKPGNLARALRGTSEAVDGGQVADEEVTLFKDSRVFTKFIPDPDKPITVTIGEAAWEAEADYAVGKKVVEGSKLWVCTAAGKSAASGSKPAFSGSSPISDGASGLKWALMAALTELESEWEKTGSGIKTKGAQSLFDEYGTKLKITYDKNPQHVIQTLTDAGTEYSLFFDGLNEVDSGNPFTARMHRVKFSPTSGLELIGDEFGKITLAFSVLKDESIASAGMSQYMQMAMV
jgi:hypothetical protein